MTSSSALWQHMRDFHSEYERNNFMCNVCGRRFKRQGELNYHMKRSHEEKRFCCDVDGCSRRFATSSFLSVHKKLVHLNQRDFKCPDCGKSFFLRRKLKIHFRITHEKFRVNCPVGNGCKFSVGRLDYMKNHLRKHRELRGAELDGYLERLKDMELL